MEKAQKYTDNAFMHIENTTQSVFIGYVLATLYCCLAFNLCNLSFKQLGLGRFLKTETALFSETDQNRGILDEVTTG